MAKAIFENMDVLASVLEPITLGTMGTQKPYRFDFEQYVQEARNKMPGRKAAGNFIQFYSSICIHINCHLLNKYLIIDILCRY